MQAMSCCSKWTQRSSRACSQARRLDKYLYRKSRQAAGKIGIDHTLRKSAARNRVTYLEQVKES